MKPELAPISETDRRAPARPGARPVILLFVVLALVVAAGIGAGVLPRLARKQALAEVSRGLAAQVPVVMVARVRTAPAHSELELPGDLQALVESPIFARVPGYLRRRLVDVGDRVAAGQLLAEIDTPELDEQIRQAGSTLLESQGALKQIEASIEQARARVHLASVTLERWKHLYEKGVFARQDADQKQADYDVAMADQRAAEAHLAAARNTVDANQASLRRLQQMKAFARITAPFAGVVTFRNMSVDSGTLIDAGSGAAGREIFRVAQVDTLRVFVNVPQSSVELVRPGGVAGLRVEELPGQVFSARIVRTADALDPGSRSMLAILEVPNPRGILHPGMYAQVRFAAQRENPALRVPSDSLVLGPRGAHVAVVEDGKVHFRAVAIQRDLGSELEIGSGLRAGELVVLDPSDDVVENAAVRARFETGTGKPGR